MSDLMKERRSPIDGYRAILVGLTPKRRELAARIEARVNHMFEKGLVEEVRGLIRAVGRDAPALKAIGYPEVARYIAGELDLEQSQYLITKATLQYAKRQMTWFRREEGVVWFAGCGDDPEVATLVEQHLRARLEVWNSVGEEALHAKTAS
jgi:tRNA dimethylallyltransferase